jgi:membrane-associated phospholipid phosphatase
VKQLLRSRGFWFFLIGVVLVAAAFYLDSAVQKWIAQHQTPAGKAFMLGVSRWGDWPTHVAVGMIGAAICWALGNRRWTTIFVAMLLACALTGIVNPVIKAAAGRARPSVKVDAGWKGPNLHQKYHAFPSGHTIATSAFFAALFLARRKIGLALLPIPLLIAVSRVYLNAHYLSDVVCGGLLGICCALIVWRLISHWEKSKGPPTIPVSESK